MTESIEETAAKARQAMDALDAKVAAMPDDKRDEYLNLKAEREAERRVERRARIAARRDAKAAPEPKITALWTPAQAVAAIKRAHGNGYKPVTVLPHTLRRETAGKQPGIFDSGSWRGWKDWETQALTATLDDLTDWHRQTGAAPNVGVITGVKVDDGYLVGVDIDCDAPELVDALAGLAGGELSFRKGRPGRSGLIPVVVDELGEREKFNCGDDTVQLLRTGKQFVAMGVHPVTKQPYAWRDHVLDVSVDMPALAALPRVKMTNLIHVLNENGFHASSESTAAKPKAGRKAELLVQLRDGDADQSFDELFVDEAAPFPISELMALNPAFVKLYRVYVDGIDDTEGTKHHTNRTSICKDLLRHWPEFTICDFAVFCEGWPGAGERVERKTAKGELDDDRLVNAFAAAESAIEAERSGAVKQHQSTRVNQGESFCAVDDGESVEGDNTGETSVKPKTKSERLNAERQKIRAKFLRVSDCRDYTAPDDLVENWLPSVGTTLLVGDSNVGKTFALLELVRCLETGEKFLGANVDPCGALLITGEGHEGLRKRLRAIGTRWPEVEVTAHLAVPDFGTNPEAALRKIAQTMEEYEAMRGRPVKLLALDNLLIMCGGKDINQQDAVSAVLTAVQDFAHDRKISIVVAAHENRSGHTAGSYALRALCDNLLRLKIERKVRYITSNQADGGKARDSETGARLHFQLDVVHVGENKWGNAVTSCVVKPYAGPDMSAVSENCETAGDTEVPMPDTTADRVEATLRVFREKVGRISEQGGDPITEVKLSAGEIKTTINRDRVRYGLPQITEPAAMSRILSELVARGDLAREGRSARTTVYKLVA